MGKQKVQTRRNERNKHNWTKRVEHALRELNKTFYYKWRGRQ